MSPAFINRQPITVTGYNILDKPLAVLALDLRSGEVNTQDLACAVIENHKGSGHSLNAYQTWDKGKIIQQARAADAALKAGIDGGSLQGLPVSVKDLYGVKGFPTFAGEPQAFTQTLGEGRTCD